jgi:hypothetical protein
VIADTPSKPISLVIVYAIHLNTLLTLFFPLPIDKEKIVIYTQKNTPNTTQKSMLFVVFCRSRRQSARKANANRRISWHAIESLLGDKCAIVVRPAIDA